MRIGLQSFTMSFELLLKKCLHCLGKRQNLKTSLLICILLTPVNQWYSHLPDQLSQMSYLLFKKTNYFKKKSISDADKTIHKNCLVHRLPPHTKKRFK